MNTTHLEMVLKRALELSSRVKNMSVVERAGLVGVEAGELYENAMHCAGHLQHKMMEEPLIEEAADVVISVFDTLAKHYERTCLTDAELIELLASAISVKLDDWERIIPK